MRPEKIEPWVQKFVDRRGNTVTTLGTDTNNGGRVIYLRPGMREHFAMSRKEFHRKFRKVAS